MPEPLTGNDCKCTVCNRIFSTERNFDRHRQGTIGTDRHCVDPSTVGLVLNYRGRWAEPGPAKSPFPPQRVGQTATGAPTVDTPAEKTPQNRKKAI